MHFWRLHHTYTQLYNDGHADGPCFSLCSMWHSWAHRRCGAQKRPAAPAVASPAAILSSTSQRHQITCQRAAGRRKRRAAPSPRGSGRRGRMGGARDFSGAGGAALVTGRWRAHARSKARVPATQRAAHRRFHRSVMVEICTAQARRSINTRGESMEGRGKWPWSRETQSLTGSLSRLSRLPLSILLPLQRDGHTQPWPTWGEKV